MSDTDPAAQPAADTPERFDPDAKAAAIRTEMENIRATIAGGNAGVAHQIAAALHQLLDMIDRHFLPPVPPPQEPVAEQAPAAEPEPAAAPAASTGSARRGQQTATAQPPA